MLSESFIAGEISFESVPKRFGLSYLAEIGWINLFLIVLQDTEPTLPCIDVDVLHHFNQNGDRLAFSFRPFPSYRILVPDRARIQAIS